jgi:hypothetical protein
MASKYIGAFIARSVIVRAGKPAGFAGGLVIW